jgi:hypothetical protein
MQRTTVLLLGLALAATSLSIAGTLEEPISLYQGMVSMALPKGWVEVPPEDLEALSLYFAEQTGGRTAEIYQYGYRPRALPSQIGFPQILIQIRESGRLPYGLFMHLPTLAEIKDHTGKNVVERGGPLVRDYDTDSIRFDRPSMSLRISGVIKSAPPGPYVVLTGAFLTERGFFIVHCFELKSEIKKNRDVFEDVFASVNIHDPLRYRATLNDRWPLLEMLDWRHYSLLALLLLILVLLPIAVYRGRR